MQVSNEFPFEEKVLTFDNILLSKGIFHINLTDSVHRNCREDLVEATTPGEECWKKY